MKPTEKLNVRCLTNLNENVMKMKTGKSERNGFGKIRSFSAIFGMLAISSALFFTACEQDDPIPNNQTETILPERFKVDIPSALSSDNTLKSATLKSGQNDTLQGGEIYASLKVFIAIAEGAADVTEAIIKSIVGHNIENVNEVTFTSDEDGRVKHAIVTKDVTYDGREWQYELTITDQESEGNEDGGIGLQVFWNNSPIEGIAMIKPANTNHNDINNDGPAIFSVEYSEKGMGDYESYMIVKITDLPVEEGDDARFACNAIKLFVGKKGDIVDVYGNSNHPNAKFFTDDTGFNWAFVASADRNLNIGVAEVALPPTTLDSDSREVILKEYSIKNVFTMQVNQWFMENYHVVPDSAVLAGYLHNADAPGYFNSREFIQGGTAPNDSYSEIEGRLNALTPYNPKEISELDIQFLQ